MSVCWRCGRSNPTDAAFCMGCGARVAGDLRLDTRKPVTILFTDLADSTRLGERFEPETVRRVLSRYFEVVARTLQRHGGTVEKFIGDAVMAVFGVPIVHEDHALRAVRAASELTGALDELNDELERDWGLRIETRTGINSGEVVAGDPAGGQALVTGDAVNVAARLQQAAAPGETLIGDATRRLAGEDVEVDAVEPLTVKGKEKPVSAWRLLEMASERHPGQSAPRTPMLGRERELRLLRETFERVVEERSTHRCTVLGAAGIGKSRIADEFRASIADEGSALVGRCLPYGEGITFWPLAEIVRQAAGDDPRAGIAELLAEEEHAGLIADRVSQAVGLSEGNATREDLMWALRAALEALARKRPLVLVFEDLHWAEAALLELIEDLAARTRDAPLMLLCLARGELLEKRPEWGRPAPNTSSIALERLSEQETGLLIDRLLAGDAVSERIREQVVERAAGNPLFVEQMLALLREEGGEDEVVVPPTIQALLTARLDRLTAIEQAAIGAASVVGKEFWRAAVLALSRTFDPSRIDAALEDLVRKDFIGPDHSTITGGDGFSFRHILIRDAAYGLITKAARAELHERFADWLEEGFQHRLIELEAILGFHLEQAYSYRTELWQADGHAAALAGRAAVKLASAGRRASRARQDATAANLLTRATKLFPESAEDRLELLPVVGEALEGTANNVGAGEVYAEALERAAATGNQAVEARARFGRAHVWFVANPEVSTEEIVAEAERAIATLEEVGDKPSLAKAWRLVGEARAYQGRAADGQRALERALAHVTPETSPRSWNALLFAIGMCRLDGPVPLEEAVCYAEERLEFARARGLHGLEADMLHVLGASQGRLGRFDEARRALSSSATISEELGLRYMAQWSKRSLGRLELSAGDPEKAEQSLRWSYDVLTEMGLHGSLGETAVPLAETLFAQRRYGDAADMLETVKDEWASGDASIDAPRLALKAKLQAIEGWDSVAERTAERAIRLVRRTDWVCLHSDALLAHAEVLRLANRPEQAVPSLESALRIAEAKHYAVAATRARRLLEEVGTELPERVV